MTKMSYPLTCACTFVFASCIFISCSEKTPPSKGGRNIQVEHDANPMRVLNPHARAATTLIVNGKGFKGVVGSEPFYLEIKKAKQKEIFDYDKSNLVTNHVIVPMSNQ